MSWSMYTATFHANKPSFMPDIADPEAVAAVVHRGLDWMAPLVDIRPRQITIRLSMNAPSGEAALAHFRGSFKSALFTAGTPQVGNWPLESFTVEAGLPADVQAAVDAGAPLAGINSHTELHAVV